MVKKHCNESVERIDVECDCVIVLKLLGTLLGTEEGCLYLSTNVPPSGGRFYDSADSKCHIVEVERCLCDLLGGEYFFFFFYPAVRVILSKR